MFNLYSHNQSELKLKISQNYRSNEKDCVEHLLQILHLSDELNDKATLLAQKLISKVRDTQIKGVSLDIFMQEFRLSSNEGVALMCLAESLLRIPDKLTQDKLIRDKITQGDWANYTKTNHLFVNAASWGLLIGSKLIAAYNHDTLAAALLKVVAKGGEPLIRSAMRRAVKLMGNQFVIGETIEEALKSRVKFKSRGYNFSFDMLGEAAMNEEYAACYMQSYIDAIIAVGTANSERDVHKGAGVSVKLSAIYPRYQRSQYHKVISELYYRLKKLYLLAKEYNVGLFIDAEEADRLEISLDLLEMLLHEPELQGFGGIGFVVQAYQKRATFVIHYIAQLAQKTNTKIMLRLVKGAYWDSEIKKAQVEGQIDYPVFTRKFYTDLSYLACAQILLNYQEHIYPLFATHNAYSLAVVYYMFEGRDFEFQCLYGMGETLYNNVVGEENLNVSCRVYAPVGKHDTLLAYLVRRLLENGANSSFVHQILDENITSDELVKNPLLLAQKAHGESNPNFTKPAHIYPLNRLNSKGLDLSDEITLTSLQTELNKYEKIQYLAHPLLAGYSLPSNRAITEVINPANKNDKVGEIIPAMNDEIELAVGNAENGFAIWSETSSKVRAQILLTMADQLEANYYELLNILVREAGKTLANAINEVREAVDFCRYYATCVLREFDNETHKPLGVFVCISPWNFPLAIFIGQVSSCLVAGNTVIAKPSYQTNLIAFYAVKLFYKSGIPENVLQFMPGSGHVVGNGLTVHPKISGVVFTGSTNVAQMINQNLSSRGLISHDSDAILIAETGGQNAMIVDSSALPEQVVADVLTSGFDSAGQRCSALRVLYLQADVADLILSMLKGAMDDLRVGDPANLATDIGPVIDSNARQKLLLHIENMKKCARMIYQTPLGRECDLGSYVAPTLIEIGSISELTQEVFGPVVHVIRFANEDLDRVINEINSTGFGLTQGLHSRIEATAANVYQNIKAGNIYINRNMVGAVVGVQPFGGEGLSGTGPKAGGPFYLYRLVNSSINPLLQYTANNEAVVNDFFNLNKFIATLEEYGFNRMEQEELFNYAENVRLNSLGAKRIELSGPTGESNFMFFAKRGTIACFAGNSIDYAKQIICALATNNEVVLPQDLHTNIFSQLSPLGVTIVKDVCHAAAINLALIAKSYFRKVELQQDLAKRDGNLVINVYEKSAGQYDLYLLMTERTVSINTTATGGNVQLISINDVVV